MQIRFDWKFYVTLIATLAGVAVPIWLWKADLQARSLRVQVISQTALQPEMPTALQGVRVSVDGQDLEKPYLTVIELTNDGTRPVPGSDYEDPLEIRIRETVKFVLAQVTTTNPTDLQPKTQVEPTSLRLNPLLLNPGDSITFAVVTSGGTPSFSVRARIAGIPAVNFEDKASTKAGAGKAALGGLIGIVLLVVYAICIQVVILWSRLEMRRYVLLISALSTCTGGFLLLDPLRSQIGLSTWQEIGIFFLLVAVGNTVGFFINRRPSSAP